MQIRMVTFLFMEKTLLLTPLPTRTENLFSMVVYLTKRYPRVYLCQDIYIYIYSKSLIMSQQLKLVCIYFYLLTKDITKINDFSMLVEICQKVQKRKQSQSGSMKNHNYY